MSSFLLLCLVLLGIWLWYCLVGRRRGLPPGPIPLPLIGNGLSLDPKDIRGSILRLSRRWGPVWTFWFGNTPNVMIADIDAARQLFLGDEAEATADRPSLPLFDLFYGATNAGILNASGGNWRDGRRFSLHTLRDFGVGRPLVEEIVRDEAVELADYLRDEAAENNGEVDPEEPVSLAISNVISRLVFAIRYPRHNPDIMRIRTAISEVQNAFVTPTAGLVNTYPWLRHLPILGHFGYDRIARPAQLFWAYVEGKIEEIRRGYDVASEPNCFVEAYLREAAVRAEKGRDIGAVNDFNMSRTIGDFWSAGFETTVVTFRWALHFLCLHQEAQSRARAELEAYFGERGGRAAEMGDRAGLPYTVALIAEVQRLANIFPFNGARKLAADVEVGGWRLAKGTTVSPLLAAFLYDERVFPEPLAFRPERFLGEGATAAKATSLPFSLGRRVCAGEPLARTELFLFLTCLIRRFRILPPLNNLGPREGHLEAQIHKPLSFHLRLQEILP